MQKTKDIHEVACEIDRQAFALAMQHGKNMMQSKILKDCDYTDINISTIAVFCTFALVGLSSDGKKVNRKLFSQNAKKLLSAIEEQFGDA